METLFQKIEFQGQEIDRRVITEASYIETLDLSGPKLVLGMENRKGYLTDSLGIREGAVLDVTLSDVERGGTWEQKIAFQIASISPSKKADEMILDCVDAKVWGLYKPGANFLFSGDSVGVILSKVMPGVKLDLDTYPLINDYHSVNSRTVNMVRQMAKELASFCWYSRGVLHFKRRTTVLAQAPAFVAERDSLRPTQGGLKIIEARPIRRSTLLKALAARQYLGYDIEKGFLVGQGELGAPQVATQHPNFRTLDALGTAAAPVADLALDGSGAVRPGVTAKLIWHNLYLGGRPLDESLPSQVIIGQVAHYELKQNYFCRATALELLA